MDTQIKNILGMVTIAALVVATGSAIVFTKSFSKSVSPTGSRSFSVQGEGKSVAVPDVAEFYFSVITDRSGSLTELQKENNEKMNKAIEYVKSQGVEERDIKTSGYDVNPQYEYFQCRAGGTCPPPKIKGYQVNQTVRVKVRDFDKVGTILSGVVQNGANSVTSLQFTLEDPYAAQNAARKEAIARAKTQAEQVAKAGGFRLGKLISIDDNGGYSPMVAVSYGRGGATMDSAVAKESVANVQPGSDEVVMTVTLRYEIK